MRIRFYGRSAVYRAGPMKRYLHADNGFVDREQWEPDSWINIEQPDAADIEFLT